MLILYGVSPYTIYQEPLARISFSAFPTCQDVNQATVSHERMDVVVGFNTGDLIWFGAHLWTIPFTSFTAT